MFHRTEIQLNIQTAFARICFSRLVAVAVAVCWLGSGAFAAADDVSDTFKLASAHYERGQWKQAIEHFELLVTQYPNDARSLNSTFFLGEALVQQSNYDAARTRYEQFVELATELESQTGTQHPFLRRARFRIGETSFLAARFDIAQTILSDFYRDYPADELLEYALPYLGQLAIDRSERGTGEMDAGIEFFDLALKRFPDGVLADECRFGLGVALISSAPEQSIRFFKHLQQHGKSSLADDATLELGRLQFQAGKYQNAAKVLAEFETRFVNSEQLTEGLYWYGRTLARSENFTEARRILELVIETEPNEDLAPAVYFEAAIVARQLDDRDESSRLLGTLVKNWPESQWVDESLLILAQNEYQAKRYAKVVEHAEQMLSKYPLSEFRQNILELQGKSLLSLEQNEESNRVFGELIEMSRGLPISQTKLATWNYLLGLGLFRIEESDKAIEAFEVAAENSTDKALRAAVNLAKSTIYLDRKEYDDAIGSLEGYLAVTKTGAARRQVQAELARAYAISNRIDEAAVVMSQLQEEPDATELVRQVAGNLAEYAFQRGDFEHSLEWFQLLAQNESGSDSTAVLDSASVARGLSGAAWSQAALGKIEEAVDTFAVLIKEYPDSRLTDEAILKQGILQAELSRSDDAIKTLSRFESDHRDSKLWPEAVLNLVRITNATGKQEHLELAANQIERLMAANVDLNEDDEFLYQLAWLQNDLGDSKSSESTFRKISHRHRSSRYWADASYRVAEIAVHENRLDEAKEILNELINTEMDSTGVAVHGLYLQGKIAVDQQDWNSVEQLMLLLVQKHPEHDLAMVGRFWRAEAAYRLKKFDVAMQRFDELHNELKKQTGGQWSDGQNAGIVPGMLLRRSQLWARKDAWHLARKLAEQFVHEYPEHATRHEADYIIGRVHSREGEFSSARKAFARVLDSDSARGTETAAMAQFMTGESYFHQENYDDAIKAYHKAEILHSYPQWQSASLLQGGKCYELKDQWHDAIVCYERLLDAFDTTEYAAEANKRLANAKNKTGN